MTTNKPTKDDTSRRGVAALLLGILKDRRVWAVLLVILSLCFVGYQIRAASKKAEDKQQLDKVKEMVAEVTPKGSVLDVVKTFGKRDREKEKAIRDEAKKLSPESRRELMQGQIKFMTGLTKQVIKMPPSQRNAVIDFFIDTVEAERKAAEKRAAEAKKNGNASGGEGDAEAARRRGPRTDEDRERGRRMFMDAMSAEDRATMIEGLRMVNDRRRERGLPPMPTGPRRQ
jgi:hypothetical protein